MLPVAPRLPPRTGSRFSTRRHVAFARTTAALALTLGLAFLPAVRAADASLYDALGGQAGIESLVDVYVERLATSPASARSFEGSNRPRIKQHLAAQLCQLAGGPCRYESDSMVLVHANLGITEREFFAGVESLRRLLRERGVPLGATNRLLALLAPMKRDIVEVRIAPPANAGRAEPARGTAGVTVQR